MTANIPLEAEDIAWINSYVAKVPPPRQRGVGVVVTTGKTADFLSRH